MNGGGVGCTHPSLTVIEVWSSGKHVYIGLHKQKCLLSPHSVSSSYNRCGFLWGKGEAFLLAGKIVGDFKFGKEKI